MNPDGDQQAGLGALTPERYLDQLRLDAARVEEILRAGPLDAPVPACPEWDLADLGLHLGAVHRWAAAAVVSASAPDGRPAPGLDRAELDDARGAARLADWYGESAGILADALSSADPAAPTWHPFPVPRITGVWHRRQCHETTIHRLDAEQAIGEQTPVAADVASDGIDEYLELVIPRLMKREGMTLPDGSLHIHCTDVAGEWLVHRHDDGDDNGSLAMRREHVKGDAAVRGPAAAILLRLWDRSLAGGGDPTTELDVVGDAAVAAAWLDLTGF